MIEKLDLKTVFLIFGDYSIYISGKSEDVIGIEGITVLKKKIKRIETVSYKKPNTVGNSTRYTHLCQFENSKIYVLFIAMYDDIYNHSGFKTLEAFYSDSQLDAVKQLHEINRKQGEIGY